MTREEHLLVCLIEECAEVQKAATKALRFGLDDSYKDYQTPRDTLCDECCDLLAVIEMLMASRTIWNVVGNVGKIIKKKARVEKFIGYARERGLIHEEESEG